ncbi:acyl-CoA dehydrogenase C-terminal domain-containing protein [Ferruginivarius sediminum]|uniref:3-methylmercaptopropionyl-CoA dehydrogenase n=1 Tax=Ferruginivarius sediminum TaxID=2661937 RepID=A0A369TEW5_9PROT|nr:acyl-CoA dehydrogenase C-terminal domain-containing protein [Ferruginivarius sediminum]RDD63808.1 acyl-CoA dehydrogenase [Ferruginivarius sediminum]
MPSYTAPLRDMRFVYHELIDGDSLQELPAYAEATPDTVDAVLEEAGKLCRDVLQPLNRGGDEEGCTYENGVVRTPAGFKEAYAAFVEGGWPSLAADPDYGGQGLPHLLNTLVEELICSANLSFGTYPGLTHGAYRALHAHASQELKDRYLPKLAEGTWTGTMCLTEPHCGTDLGLVRTKAETNDDGSYAISGTKIYISCGEHDLAENIVHLVLARLPGAPAGTKGISLFVVPKFLPNEDGTPGVRNGVSCGGIEHKMGLNASATCVMNFEGATGWLVGESNKGMRQMFTMMNLARLAVGIQGIGLSEASYQGAVQYAHDRKQGRGLNGPRYPDRKADPIVVHPDVRRMLLTMRAYTEGMRALGAWVAREADIADAHPDADRRQQGDDLVALMTPVVKALFTDLGYDVTNLGVQIHGGSGYVRETGMEQFVRDCRIAQIYEGANGIQGLDLVGRKMPAHTGRSLRRFFHPVANFLAEHQDNKELAPFVQPLSKGFGRLQTVTGWLAQKGLSDPEEAGAAATDYLRLIGLVALGYMWARTAQVALAHTGDDGDGFYAAKLATARFFMQKLLPQTGALVSQIMSGKDALMDVPESAFALSA